MEPRRRRWRPGRSASQSASVPPTTRPSRAPAWRSRSCTSTAWRLTGRTLTSRSLPVRTAPACPASSSSTSTAPWRLGSSRSQKVRAGRSRSCTSRHHALSSRICSSRRTGRSRSTSESRPGNSSTARATPRVGQVEWPGLPAARIDLALGGGDLAAARRSLESWRPGTDDLVAVVSRLLRWSAPARYRRGDGPGPVGDRRGSRHRRDRAAQVALPGNPGGSEPGPEWPMVERRTAEAPVQRSQADARRPKSGTSPPRREAHRS